MDDPVTEAIPVHDAVNHPGHYMIGPACPDCGRIVECIDVTERLSFTIGNAVKYLWRADYKGDAIQDLQKAVWYIQREIDRRQAGRL